MNLCRQSLDELTNRDLNPHYGATCGRVAGRIAKATFKANNEQYNLTANNHQNSLHGGTEGYSLLVWDS